MNDEENNESNNDPIEYPKPLQCIFDNFIEETNDVFYKLKIAYQFIASKYFAGKNIDLYANEGKFEAIDAGDFYIEDIPMSDIKKFKRKHPDFLMEIFHGKLVQLWHNCIVDIFTLLVYSHFSDNRKFTELGTKYPVKLNFTLNKEDLFSQLPQTIINEFKSKNGIMDKTYTIRNTLDSKEIDNNCFKEIHKNILVRNAIQHNNSVIDEKLPRTLDNNNPEFIYMLNLNGEQVCCRCNEKITLSFFEIQAFIQAMHTVINGWRNVEV
jgi:hypothetical protein